MAPLAAQVDPLLDWGIPVLRWFNTLPDAVGPLFEFASFVGSVEGLTVLAATVLWSISARIGWRVIVILLVYGALNTPMKVAFGLPRPYWVLQDITARASEPSYGLPSGHSGFAMAVLGRLTVAASRARARATAWRDRIPAWAPWTAGGLLIASVGASRLYLGVHWPTDVLGGFVAGAVVLLLALRWEPPVSSWLRSASVPRGAALAAGSSLVLLAVVALASVLTSDQQVPEAWSQLAASAVPGGEELDPRALDGPIGATGALFGFAIGWLAVQRQGGFDAGGSIGRRLARLPLGLAGAIVLFGGVGVEPTGDASTLDLALTWLQYAAAGGWMAWGAPSLFIALGLARRPARPDPDERRRAPADAV